MIRLLRSLILLVGSVTAGVWLGRFRRQAPPETIPLHGTGRLSPWKTLARHFALFTVVLAVGGFLLAASGMVPIKASSGHWAITRWFLNFSSRRSVETHTMGREERPKLDDPALILKGAGHYETGCRPCHGGPGGPAPRISVAMTPHPPNLSTVVPTWEPDELFYIVKHGIKFTGMPAWPARNRDDEVWAVVAFLRALPELDAQAYDRLVNGESTSAHQDTPLQGLQEPAGVPDIVTGNCARCHGTDGLGRGSSAFPKLAGQSPSYFYATLVAYAAGRRHSGIMEPIAAGLNPEEMRLLARYYGSLPIEVPRLSPHTRQAIERGRTIAFEGIPGQGVPACVDCHGPSAGRRNPFYPSHAGQYADYLVLQLDLFKKQHRGGTPYAHLMRRVAQRLTPEQSRDVALYYESLSTP